MPKWTGSYTQIISYSNLLLIFLLLILLLSGYLESRVHQVFQRPPQNMKSPLNHGNLNVFKLDLTPNPVYMAKFCCFYIKTCGFKVIFVSYDKQDLSIPFMHY